MDRILSISAIVSATAAVLISVYQAYITREYQEISVWPYLYQYNSGADDQYHRLVQNFGTGPAMVRSFQVRVDGEVMRNWTDVISTLTGTPREEVHGAYFYSSLGAGMVLLPEIPHELLTMPRQPIGWRFHEEVGRMSTRICYCSLYGDCWIADSAAREPQPVEACPAASDDEFGM